MPIEGELLLHARFRSPISNLVHTGIATLPSTNGEPEIGRSAQALPKKYPFPLHFRTAADKEITESIRRCAMEFKILHALPGHKQPTVDISVFCESSSGIDISILDFMEPCAIDLCRNGLEWQRKNRTLSPAPDTFVGYRLAQLS